MAVTHFAPVCLANEQLLASVADQGQGAAETDTACHHPKLFLTLHIQHEVCDLTSPQLCQANAFL